MYRSGARTSSYPRIFPSQGVAIEFLQKHHLVHVLVKQKPRGHEREAQLNRVQVSLAMAALIGERRRRDVNARVVHVNRTLGGDLGGAAVIVLTLAVIARHIADAVAEAIARARFIRVRLTAVKLLAS